MNRKMQNLILVLFLVFVAGGVWLYVTFEGNLEINYSIQ